MESAWSYLPSNALWIVLATSVASLVLLFAGLHLAHTMNNRRQRKKGKGKAWRSKASGRAKAKPRMRP